MRVLVVFHVYYEQFAGYYLEKLKNIHSCKWDIVVTGASLSEDLKKKVAGVNPEAVFLETENVGYDVWPFIAAVKRIDLGKYDFIIKLHTKNEDGYTITLNGIKMDGRMWKELLVDALVGSRERFSRLLDIFGKHPEAGIAYNRQLGFRAKGVQIEDCRMLDVELSRLGIERRGSYFCAGTMFAVRSSALAFLQDERITASCFSVSGKSHEGATLAHVYERLMPIAVQALGYRYFPLFDSPYAAVKFTVKDIVTPTLEWIFSVNYHGGRERKCVTIFGHKFICKVRKRL